MLGHLWPVVLWHHPAVLLDMANGALLGWLWLTPPTRKRIA